ncbi:hypothetical protein MMF93_04740 [Streptomyces tubbatahanensis]|uniref:NAD-dependent epimerase/dehydratase domain-containing protein n=1 Tax=Streptomyces tubbatahanensis TaxID=2923272 RepID=A0ABY3XN60_9ACTN|nr:NAD-dependent epimerase/dehydratase family protein [Streptomyces tubbatahanensis]UNS95877.1 hypothetical protein MMF93_04740 [Streptomyces tubbatahanensis]
MIGVIGGYGDVGAHAVLALRRAGHRVRLGGRSARAAAEFRARHLPGDTAVEHRVVDVRDGDSVTAFAKGLSVLVNCAGPSHLTGSAAADGALRAGTDYVDAAGDDALYALLDDGRYRSAGRTAVLSAGLRPGLTGLFPRAVARLAQAGGMAQAETVTVRTRVRDLFTRTSALEYLHGASTPGPGPRAAWRDGALRSRALTRHSVTDQPFFRGTHTVLPQLSAEDARTAQALGVRDGDWLTLIQGEHVLAALDRVHVLPPEEAAEALCRAARLDLAGCVPAVTMVVVLTGGAAARAAVLHGTGNAPLSGAVAAHTATSVLRGEIPPGRYFAAEALDPESAVATLTRGPGPDGGAPCARAELLPEGADPFAPDAVAEMGAL